MTKIHSYSVYGLEIHSEVSIPEMPTGRDLHPDVFICYGNPPTTLEGEKSVGRKFESQKQHLLIKTDKIARILISNGNKIVVHPLPGSHEHQVRLLLMGWGFGALFQQRNTVALHGSVINSGDKGFVICAPSGVGKSSLTLAFIKQGYQYLDDNIAVFSLAGETPMVLPGYPQMKLWKDTIERFNIEESEPEPLFPHVQKFQISFNDQFRNHPSQITVIYILTPTKQSSLSLTTLSGHKSFDMLLSQVFCRQFITGISQYEELFSSIIKIANTTKIVLVNLPEPRCDLIELLDFIEKDLLLQE
ncbi:MAG: hypothetical protein SCH68_12075 [Brevefilum sp.]|nr:hypothetical protein [Brevefilum sp.]